MVNGVFTPSSGSNGIQEEVQVELLDLDDLIYLQHQVVIRPGYRDSFEPVRGRT